MVIIKKNLDLAIANLQRSIKRAKSGDGDVVDSLVLLESCKDMLRSVKAARRWVPMTERWPTQSGRYEVIIIRPGRVKEAAYADFNHLDNWIIAGSVTHWRKQPRLK